MATGQDVKRLLAEWESKRKELLAVLSELTPEQLNAQADGGRSVREMMHRVVDHDRDSCQYLMAMRRGVGVQQNDVNRLLCQIQAAQGELAANLAGLADEYLDKEWQSGEWTIRQLLDHIARVDGFWLSGISKALGR
jgi:hypothetical protein